MPLKHSTQALVNCMMTFGFTMAESESLIVKTGAPRIRYAPLSFTLPDDIESITFSFNQWVFAFMKEEWTALGLPEFEKDLEVADEMDPVTFSRALNTAIALAKVCRNPHVGEDAFWGVYSVRGGQWVAGKDVEYMDRTIH